MAYIPDDGSAAHYVHRSFRGQRWRSHGPLTHLLMSAGFVIGIPVVLEMIVVLVSMGAAFGSKRGRVAYAWRRSSSRSG